MPAVSQGTGQTAFLGVALAAAIALGLVPGGISVLAALLLGGLLLVALFVVVLRRATVPLAGPPPDPEPESLQPELAETDPAIRLARGLFYTALVTLAWASFRPVLGLTVSQILFFGSLFVCVLAVLRGVRLAIVPAPILAAALIFAIGAGISSVGAASPAQSFGELLQGLYVIVLWGWTGSMVLQTRRHLAVAVTFWVMSAAICGFAALNQAIGLDVLVGDPVGRRMTGLMPHPNDLGGAMAVALVPGLVVAGWPVSVAGRAAIAFRWLPVALIATGLILSASVGGVAAAVAGLVIWLGSPAVRPSARLGVAGVVVLAIVASSLAGGRVTSPVERFESVTSPGLEAEAGSGEDRISVAHEVWPRITENPVVGTGLDSPGTSTTIISHRISNPQQIHGLPLAAWYATGIVGLLGLLVLFSALAVSIIRGVRDSVRADDSLLGWALLATFASFLVYSLNGPMSFQQYAWVAVMFAVTWSVRARPLPDGYHGTAGPEDRVPETEQLRQPPDRPGGVLPRPAILG